MRHLYYSPEHKTNPIQRRIVHAQSAIMRLYLYLHQIMVSVFGILSVFRRCFFGAPTDPNPIIYAPILLIAKTPN